MKLKRIHVLKLSLNTLFLYIFCFVVVVVTLLGFIFKYPTDMPILRISVAATIILSFFGDFIPFVLSFLGMILFPLKLRGMSISLLKIALRFSKDSPFLQNQLAYYLAEENIELEMAEDLARKAFRQYNRSSYVADTLGWVLYRRKKYEDALIYFKKAFKKKRFQTAVNFHMGLCYWKTSDIDRAVFHLKRASMFRLINSLSLKDKRQCITVLNQLGVNKSPVRLLFDACLRVVLIILLVALSWQFNKTAFGELILWYNTVYNPQPDYCWATRLYDSHLAQINIDQREGNYEEVFARWAMLREGFISDTSTWTVDLQIAELLAELGELKQAEHLSRQVFQDISKTTERKKKNELNLTLADILINQPVKNSIELKELMQEISEDFVKYPDKIPKNREERLSVMIKYKNIALYYRILSLMHEKIGSLDWEKVLEAEKKSFFSTLKARDTLKKWDLYVDLQTLLSYNAVNSYLFARNFFFGEWESQWHANLGESLFRQGNAYLKLNQNQEAEEAFSLAEEHFASFDRAREKLDSPKMKKLFSTNIFLENDSWKILDYRSRIFMSRGKMQRAAEFSKKAVNLLENLRQKLRSKNKRTNFALGREEVYQQAVLMALCNNENQWAFEALEALKSRALLDDFAVHWYRDNISDFRDEKNSGESEELAALNRKIYDHFRRILSRTGKSVESRLQLEKLVKEKNRLFRQRKKIYSYTSSNPQGLFFSPISACTITDIQSVLKNDEAILEYFYIPDGEAYVWLVKKTDNKLMRLQASAREVLTALKILAIEISDPGKVRSNQWMKPARTLYRSLLGSIAPGLESIRHLVIIPYGELHAIPFEVLLDKNNESMTEKVSISYAPSATIFFHIREELRDRQDKGFPPKGNRKITAVYDPLATLPGSLREARFLADRCGAEVIPVKAAVPANILKKIREADIVHFGVHSLADTEEPLLSFLVLTQNNKNPGLLDIYSILMEDGFKTTSLVFLASCQSGMTDYVLPGDNVYNLGTCFIAAGARTCISARWKIADAATTFLVKQFYNKLELGAAQALRSAQSETREKYPHPYFWAGFMISGEPWE